jgi:hypothetical protein
LAAIEASSGALRSRTAKHSAFSVCAFGDAFSIPNFGGKFRQLFRNEIPYSN